MKAQPKWEANINNDIWCAIRERRKCSSMCSRRCVQKASIFRWPCGGWHSPSMDTVAVRQLLQTHTATYSTYDDDATYFSAFRISNRSRIQKMGNCVGLCCHLVLCADTNSIQGATHICVQILITYSVATQNDIQKTHRCVPICCVEYVLIWCCSKRRISTDLVSDKLKEICDADAIICKLLLQFCAKKVEEKTTQDMLSFINPLIFCSIWWILFKRGEETTFATNCVHASWICRTNNILLSCVRDPTPGWTVPDFIWKSVTCGYKNVQFVFWFFRKNMHKCCGISIGGAIGGINWCGPKCGSRLCNILCVVYQIDLPTNNKYNYPTAITQCATRKMLKCYVKLLRIFLTSIYHHAFSRIS